MQKKILTILLITISILSTACSKSSVTESNSQKETTAPYETETETETKPSETEEEESTTVTEEETSETEMEEVTTEASTMEESTTAPDKVETPTTAPVYQPEPPTASPNSGATTESELDVLVKNIIAQTITSSMTQLEKAIAIHDYITYNIDYDYDNYLAGTIPGASYSAVGGLTTGKAVCSGYADIFSLLAKEAGLEVAYVSGTADNGSGGGYAGHAWNQVKIDGVWYNVDTTWDDPTWKGKPASDHSANCYNYFLVSDATLGKDHKPDYVEHQCPNDYSKVTITKAIVAGKSDSVYVENETELNTNIKNMINSGKQEFYIYMNESLDATTEKTHSAIRALNKPYAINSMHSDGDGIWKCHIKKIENAYSVTSQSDIKAVLDANKNKLDDLQFWYYDENLTTENFYPTINAALLKSGYAAEMYTCSDVLNGQAIFTIQSTQINFVNDVTSFNTFFDNYSVNEIGNMKFVYTGNSIQPKDFENAILAASVPKGWYPIGLSIYTEYDVTHIYVNDFRKVVYVENTDQIAEFAKNNSTQVLLETNFVFKTAENNIAAMCMEAEQKLEDAISINVFSSYYNNGEYVMFMIESIG